MSPIQKHNRKRYAKDWKLRSRFIRFYRARGKCEWCAAEHGKPHPVTGSLVALTVAHVHDFRPENCSLLNLAALCQRCHLNLDRPYHKRMRAQNLHRRKAVRDLFA